MLSAPKPRPPRDDTGPQFLGFFSDTPANLHMASTP